MLLTATTHAVRYSIYELMKTFFTATGGVPASQPVKFSKAIVLAPPDMTDVLWVGDDSLDPADATTALSILAAGDFYDFSSQGAGNRIYASTMYVVSPTNDSQPVNFNGVAT